MTCEDCLAHLVTHLDGELPPKTEKAMAGHLAGCAGCVQAMELLRREQAAYARYDGKLSLSPALWPTIQEKIAREKQRPSKPVSPWEKLRLQPRKSLLAYSPALALCVILLAVALWKIRSPAPVQWTVNRLQGTGRLDAGNMKAGQFLIGGQEAETGPRSELEMSFDEGTVTLSPDTRLRIIRSDSKGQTLDLLRGTLQAHLRTSAGKFRVQTPTAEAVDLGCSFTLTVNPTGTSRLQVAAGSVALRAGGRESFVPAGGECSSSEKTGLGVPFYSDSTPAFRLALKRLHFNRIVSTEAVPHFWVRRSTENAPPAGQQREALKKLLHEARFRDTLTLWHLLSRVEPDSRGLLFDRMAQLSPPPVGIHREAILRLDSRAMEEWKEALRYQW